MRPRRRTFRGRQGEVAVFDIVLFIPLLLVGLLLLDSILSVPVSQVSENVNSSRYAAEGMATLLGGTVPHTLGWGWYPACNPLYCYSPCPNPFQGCWYQVPLVDYPVQDLIQLDAYLVSCHAFTEYGYVVTQAGLDQPGWMGYSIQNAAQSVAEGIVAGSNAPSSTFTSYSLQFNGTSFPGGTGCTGPITPMRAYDGLYPAYPTGQTYTWSTVIPSPQGTGYPNTLVQMAFWGP